MGGTFQLPDPPSLQALVQRKGLSEQTCIGPTQDAQLLAGPSMMCPVVVACGQDLSATQLFRGPESAAEPLAKHLGNATFERCAASGPVAWSPLSLPGAKIRRTNEQQGCVVLLVTSQLKMPVLR